MRCSIGFRQTIVANSGESKYNAKRRTGSAGAKQHPEVAMPKHQSTKSQSGAGERLSRQDALYYRILAIIGATVVIELFLVFVQRRLNSASTAASTYTLLLVIQYIFLALAAVFLVIGVLRAVSSKPRFSKVPAGALTLACAAVALICLVARAAGSSVVSSISIALLFAAVTYFIFYSCQREFFYTALIAGVAILALLVVRTFYEIDFYAGRAYLAVGAALLVTAAVAAVVLVAHRHGGVIKLPGQEYRCLTSGVSIIPLVVMMAVSLACLMLALIAGISSVFYSVFIVAGCVFVCAVYYIVKLIQS